jgi:hypothetical protein
MQRWVAMVTLLGLTMLVGCGENRFDRAVTGSALGAGTGALAGLALGPVGVTSGALIGAGAGAATGAVTTSDQVNLGRPIYR